MSKKEKSIITIEKLYNDLLEIDEEIEYEIMYWDRAREYLKNLELGEIDQELIAAIRLESCLDREHLKGDYFRIIHQVF